LFQSSYSFSCDSHRVHSSPSSLGSWPISWSTDFSISPTTSFVLVSFSPFLFQSLLLSDLPSNFRLVLFHRFQGSFDVWRRDREIHSPVTIVPCPDESPWTRPIPPIACWTGVKARDSLPSSVQEGDGLGNGIEDESMATELSCSRRTIIDHNATSQRLKQIISDIGGETILIQHHHQTCPWNQTPERGPKSEL
jgi:hypothetical protein